MPLSRPSSPAAHDGNLNFTTAGLHRELGALGGSMGGNRLSTTERVATALSSPTTRYGG